MKTKRDFQIFAKIAGAACNLNCHYCYYLNKNKQYSHVSPMNDTVLETYIRQHIEACPEQIIRFSWHGGEPTLPGIAYFEKIIRLQQKYCPSDRQIVNGIQTNATLIDEDWSKFLAEHQFIVGVSMDGPEELHNQFRRGKSGQATHDQTLRGFQLLQRHGTNPEILCVVNAENVQHPLKVYRYFKELGAEYMTFLPLVEPTQDTETTVSKVSVPSKNFGNFLCIIFDEWMDKDIGSIKVQIFEEATRTAFKQQHSLCIFRETCGDIPVVEHNGDFYACDHYVNPQHLHGNIMKTHLGLLIESPVQRQFGENKKSLPAYCLHCEVRNMCNGGCPKNRIIDTPDGEPGLNYLCAGYKLFFNHCRPFVEQVAQLWCEQNPIPSFPLSASKSPGRNDPCPCGSGKKYKKCCLNKSGRV